MARFLKDTAVVFVVSIVYLIGIITCRVPFFMIFLVGCVLFIGGLITALFFNKGTKERRVSLTVAFTGLMSSIEIWVLVVYLLARLQ